jgi:hypothetical protein
MMEKQIYKDATDETLVEWGVAYRKIREHNISDWDKTQQILESSRVRYYPDGRIRKLPAKYSTEKISKALKENDDEETKG